LADGTNRHARNVITGTTGGFPIVAFDYSYETESTDSDGGRTKSTHRYAVTALAAWLPPAAVGDAGERAEPNRRGDGCSRHRPRE